MTFDDVTTWTPDGENRWTGEVPPEWSQGRAAFGGVVAAAGLRSLRTLVDPERTPRTVTTTFFGPVTTGPATMTARVLRTGRSVSFAEAEVMQGDSLRVRVSGVFGADRPTVTRCDLPPVDVPTPDGFVAFPHIPGVTPAFIQQMDVRWTEGGFPFTGTKDGTVMASLSRFRTPPARGPERLLGLLDVMPAPVLQQLDGPRPASTVVWTSHFAAPDTVPPGEYVFFRYETVTASGGYSTATGRLYDAHGRLLAWQEQLHAVFG